MKWLRLLLIVWLFTPILSSANGYPDDDLAVRQVIQNYIDGTSNADPTLIKSAFHPQAQLLLNHSKKPFWQVSASEYASWFSKKSKSRDGYLLSLKVDGDTAVARAKITTYEPVKQYVDQFLLKRFDDKWLIVSKTATQTETEKNKKQLKLASGKRVLFIASSADFHGDSKLATGTSFSELVHAYDVFIKAGYQVDFVTPKGGQLPLAYINTSDPMHRKYIYDRDFMYALANTAKPEQIDATQYLAVHYVGGGNAMYQVAENKVLQKISMQVYEQNQGIVSSVCHGTAGIVNLRLSNGEYLVSGKTISGYPIAFEKTDAAYYQEFPFEIETLIKQRGGTFKYGERNQSYVEIDGKIITGTNFQSSKAVAEAMVNALNKL
ncbi:MAG: nuclear transport factor 2 family protein [Pseudomonadota bacterium]